MWLARLQDFPAQQAMLPAPIARALTYLQEMNLATLAPGRYALEGEQMFVLIQDVTLRAEADSLSEAHRQHADIQLPVSGVERFGVALPAMIDADEDRFAHHDIAFYRQPPAEFFVEVAAGAYIVFLPGEFHRPCLMPVGAAPQTPLRKAVIKIHRDLLAL